MDKSGISLLEPFNEYLASKQDSQRSLLSLALSCQDLRAAYKQKLPFHINVISAAARGKLKETAHSIILHDLLHHPAVLDSFIKNVVGLNDNPFSVEDINTPDKNRIDLCLRNEDRCIIIENKVNSADEQPGQIYRYFQLVQKEYGIAWNNIHILYLNPDHREPPSLFSRSKEGQGREDDPETVNVNKITVKDYKHDIYSWLNECKDIISSETKDEAFLHSALNQYIDYLEERFQMNHRYKELRDMTEKQIRQMLNIDDQKSVDDQIEIVEGRLSQLTELQSALQDLKLKLENEAWRNILSETEKNLKEKFGERIYFSTFGLKIPEMGFFVAMKNIVVRVSLVYWTNHTPYWRMIVNSKDGSDTTETKEIIKNLLTPLFPKHSRGGAEWDFYSTTSKENAQLRLQQLAEIFLSSPGFELL